LEENMPFRDADGAIQVTTSWDLLEHDTLGDLFVCRFNEVMWAFPSAMLVKFLLHEYESLERKVIYELYEPGDRVVEAGSGSGITGLSILRAGAALETYEPQKSFRELASSIYASNGYEDVRVIGAAVASRTGSVVLSVDKVSWDATILDCGHYEGAEVMEVPCIAVNDVLDDFDATALHLDVEGAEVDIISGLDLSKINKFSAEIHPSMIGFGAYDDIIKAKLIDAGFEMVSEAGYARNYPTHNYVVGWKRKDNG
jgi:FkbM family methyltransferase